MVLSLGVFLAPLLSLGYILTEGRMRSVRGLRLAERPTAP
jgi:hypothetical protein